MTTGFRVLCNEKAREYKCPAQRWFPQIWQSLPLTRAPSAYCAFDGPMPACLPDEPQLSLPDRRAGSHDDDNSTLSQYPLPAFSRDEPKLALQDASEWEKGLIWQDDEFPPLSDV